MPSAHILFADDDADILFSGALALRQAGYKVSTLQDPEQLISSIKKTKPDLVLLDMNFRSSIQNGNEGMYWLRQLKKSLNIPVVMLTAYGEIELAVQAMKHGASDFLTKPWENNVLHETIANALTRKKNAVSSGFPNSEGINALIGASESMETLKQTIRKIAPTDASVLIMGENGTGKDLVARAIHELSKRNKGEFVAVDLGAIPDGLFESNFFGHKKGAFTDAKADFSGRFVQADKGTLFMDELGNIPLHLQAKLLVALQNRAVQALGDSKIQQVDIRLISATNAPIDRLVAEQKFRQDFLYRLNTVTLRLAPLRERMEDLPLLANHFLSQYIDRYQKPGKTLSKEATNKLMKHQWPGNIRELQHVLERAVILSEKDEITAYDIEVETTILSQDSAAVHAGTLEEMEKTSIEKALQKHRGNISAVANELGLSRAALYRRLSKYNL